MISSFNKNKIFIEIIVLSLLIISFFISCKEKKKISFASTCQTCHTETHHTSSYHMKNVGCTDCHKGLGFEKDKTKSHKGLIVHPGNLSNVDQTCGVCHADETSRVKKSIMTTNRGLVQVNRQIFKEAHNMNVHDGINHLKYKTKASDSYAAQLCASCHLGQDKKYLGKWQKYEKGGGCLACHLNEISNKNSNTNEQQKHLAITNKIDDQKCFNCHSRSGRISLNYKGWHESTEPNKKNPIQLPDKRKVYYFKEDVHHKTGMSCIDCHTNHELMGDGHAHAKKDEALKVGCTDCHEKELPVLQKEVIHKKKLSKEKIHPQKKRIYRIVNAFTEEEIIKLVEKELTHKKRKYRLVENGKEKLTHIVDIFISHKKDIKQSYLKSKITNKIHKINSYKKHMGHDNNHERLTCEACHTQWTPQCIGCHLSYSNKQSSYNHVTQKKQKGRWIESYGIFFAQESTLGVAKDNKYHSFIPGMKLSIDKSNFYKKKMKVIYENLFSPVSSHTIGSSRNCKSCHQSSLALGYGRGQLEYKNKNWIFHNEYEIQNFGRFKNLALDGWIKPFTNYYGQKMSTHKGSRPINTQEQKKILNVGLCLTCHKESSQIFNNFNKYKNYKHKKDIYSKSILFE